jgi:hypothetical protein
VDLIYIVYMGIHLCSIDMYIIRYTIYNYNVHQLLIIYSMYTYICFMSLSTCTIDANTPFENFVYTRETKPSPRVILFGESQTLGSRRRAPWRNSSPRAKEKLSVKNSSPRVFFLALGEVIFKNSPFHLQTLFIINMHLYKGYVQIWHNFILVCYI